MSNSNRSSSKVNNMKNKNTKDMCPETFKKHTKIFETKEKERVSQATDIVKGEILKKVLASLVNEKRSQVLKKKFVNNATTLGEFGDFDEEKIDHSVTEIESYEWAITPLTTREFKSNIRKVNALLEMFNTLDDFKKALRGAKYTRNELVTKDKIGRDMFTKDFLGHNLLREIQSYFNFSTSYTGLVNKIVHGNHGYILTLIFQKFIGDDKIKKVERRITFRGPNAIGFKNARTRKEYRAKLMDPMQVTPEITHTIKIMDTQVQRFIDMNTYALTECFPTIEFKKQTVKKKRGVAVFWDQLKAKLPITEISKYYSFLGHYSYKNHGKHENVLSGFKGRNDAIREKESNKQALARNSNDVKIKTFKKVNGKKVKEETIIVMEVDHNHLLNELNITAGKQLVLNKSDRSIMLEILRHKAFAELRTKPKDMGDEMVRELLLNQVVKSYTKALKSYRSLK